MIGQSKGKLLLLFATQDVEKGKSTFATIFSAAGDCQVLRNALLTRLAQAEAGTGALTPVPDTQAT